MFLHLSIRPGVQLIDMNRNVLQHIHFNEQQSSALAIMLPIDSNFHSISEKEENSSWNVPETFRVAAQRISH